MRASSGTRIHLSFWSPMDLVNASTRTSFCSMICLAIAPAATIAAVSLPENWPLPLRSWSGNFSSAGRSAWPGLGLS